MSPHQLATVQSLLHQPAESCSHLAQIGAANHRRPELSLPLEHHPTPSSSDVDTSGSHLLMNHTFAGPGVGTIPDVSDYETMESRSGRSRNNRFSAVYENCIRMIPRYPVRGRSHSTQHQSQL